MSRTILFHNNIEQLKKEDPKHFEVHLDNSDLIIRMDNAKVTTFNHRGFIDVRVRNESTTVDFRLKQLIGIRKHDRWTRLTIDK